MEYLPIFLIMLSKLKIKTLNLSNGLSQWFCSLECFGASISVYVISWKWYNIGIRANISLIALNPYSITQSYLHGFSYEISCICCCCMRLNVICSLFPFSPMPQFPLPCIAFYVVVFFRTCIIHPFVSSWRMCKLFHVIHFNAAQHLAKTDAKKKTTRTNDWREERKKTNE